MMFFQKKRQGGEEIGTDSNVRKTIEHYMCVVLLLEWKKSSCDDGVRTNATYYNV
jgi:hypothetical protein